MIKSLLMKIDETPEAEGLTDNSLPTIQPKTRIHFNYFHTMCCTLSSRICYAKESISTDYVGAWIRLVSFRNNGNITDCEPIKFM